MSVAGEEGSVKTADYGACATDQEMHVHPGARANATHAYDGVDATRGYRGLRATAERTAATIRSGVRPYFSSS